MSIFKKSKKLITDPLYNYFWARAKINNNFYLSDLRKQGQQLGLTQPKFLLSFDCDTSADIKSSLTLYKKFSINGIYPVIAAPADIVEEGLKEFRELAKLGATFLNHGSSHHAATNKQGEIFSTLTYSELSESEWIKDITEGHQRLKDYLGVTVKGFRTPHFGEFNSPSTLKCLYQVLNDLNYNHSSSTTPLFASIAHRSKKWSSNKITEFPVNGLLDKPAQIIDSWSFSKPGSNTASQVQLIIKSLQQYDQLFNTGENIFLNIYFDPAQLEKQEAICDQILNFSPWAIKSFEELLVSN